MALFGEPEKIIREASPPKAILPEREIPVMSLDSYDWWEKSEGRGNQYGGINDLKARWKGGGPYDDEQQSWDLSVLSEINYGGSKMYRPDWYGESPY